MLVHVSKGIQTSKFGYITTPIDSHLAIRKTINAIDSTKLPRFLSNIQLLWGHKKVHLESTTTRVHLVMCNSPDMIHPKKPRKQ